MYGCYCISPICVLFLNIPFFFLDFRGTEKLQYLKTIGADHVIDSSKESIMESAKSFLKAKGLKGVDVLYDPVGGKLTQDSLKLLNWGAHILIIGFASGDVPIIRANSALVKVNQFFLWNFQNFYFSTHSSMPYLYALHCRIRMI